MAKSPYKKDQELLPDPITRQSLQFRVVFSAITHFHTLDFTEPLFLILERLSQAAGCNQETLL